MRIAAALLLLTAAPSPAQFDAHGDPLPPGALARFGTARLCHSNVRDGGIAFRPDGRAVVTWNGSSAILWDFPGGKLVWALTDGPAGVAFAPDGRSLATAGKGGLQLVDAATGQVTRVLAEGTWTVPAISPDGRTVAAVSRGRASTLELWDVATGRRMTRLGYEDLPLRVLAFAPDGKTLVATVFKESRDESFVRVLRWDVAAGQSLRPFRPPGTVIAHALSDDGRRLATREPQTAITLWDATTGAKTGEVEAGWGTFRFAPGGTRLVVSDYGQPGDIRVTVWDATTARREASILVPREYGEYAQVSPDGRSVLTAGPGTLVCGWDAATGQRRPDLPNHGRNVLSVRFTADGKRLVSTGNGGRVWDVTTAAQTAFIPLEPNTGEGAFTLLPGGGGLRGAANVQRIDLVTGKPAGQPFAPPKLPDGQPGDHFYAHDLAVSPDGRTAVATGIAGGPRPGAGNSEESVSRTPYMVNWDVATRRVTREGPPPAEFHPAGLAADGRTAFVRRYVHSAETQDQSVDVRAVDATTGLTRGERRLPRWFIPQMASSADGQSLATAGVRTRTSAVMDFQMFETRTFGVRTTFDVARSDARDGLSALALSPDGRLAALARYDERIHVFDAVTGRELTTFTARDELPAGALAFSRDGQRLASGHFGGTLLLWAVPAAPLLPVADPEAAWADLGAGDARLANAASWALAMAPAAAVPFLAERLKPADAAAVGRVRAILADLDSVTFAKREAASRGLEALGEDAEALLADALAGAPTPEQRARLKALLETPGGPLNLLRVLRAIEALERIATPEAAAVLRTLAGGPPGLRSTLAAADALARADGRLKP